MSRASLNHQTAMRNVATNHPPSPPRPPSPPPPPPHPSHPHQPGGSSRAHRGAPHVWRALPRLIHCAQRRPASGGAHVLRAAGGGAGWGRQGAGTHRRAHRRGRRRRQTPQGETGGRAQGCCGRQVKGLPSRLPVGAASIPPPRPPRSPPFRRPLYPFVATHLQTPPDPRPSKSTSQLGLRIPCPLSTCRPFFRGRDLALCAFAGRCSSLAKSPLCGQGAGGRRGSGC